MKLLPQVLCKKTSSDNFIQHGKRGFTLIELLVVISIIAVLSTVGAVAYTQITKNARDSARKSSVVAISRVLEQKYNGGFYDTNISASDFAGGVPQPPRDGDYHVYFGQNAGSFAVCARLENSPTTRYCSTDTSTPADQCYCVYSAQGGATRPDPTNSSLLNANGTSMITFKTNGKIDTYYSGATAPTYTDSSIINSSSSFTPTSGTTVVGVTNIIKSTSSLVNGLVAYWELEDSNGRDSCNGSTSVCTASGGVNRILTQTGSSITYGKGRFGNSAIFAGSTSTNNNYLSNSSIGDYITSTNTNINIPGSFPGFTFAGWFKISPAVTTLDANKQYSSSAQGLAAKGTQNAPEWALRMHGTRGSNSTNLVFTVYKSGTSGGVISTQAYFNLGAVKNFVDGDWHLVVGRYKSKSADSSNGGSGFIRLDVDGTFLYYNGQLATGATVPCAPGANCSSDGVIPSSTGSLYLGSEFFDYGMLTGGAIDSFGLWNRCLSDDEVNLLYNNAIYPYF